MRGGIRDNLPRRGAHAEGGIERRRVGEREWVKERERALETDIDKD